MASLLDRALNVGEAKKFKTYQKRVALIDAFEAELEHDSDAELRERMDALRERAREGESLDALLPECFAIVRETGKRTMGMRHFDVQMIGGMALHDGQIAEMKTGEGKTLTATLAVVLNSLAVRDRGDPGNATWPTPTAAGAQGRARGHRQRLPGATRRGMDEPDLRRARRLGRRAAEHAALRGEAARVRVRRGLRHQLGVRLRLPARQHGQGPRRKGPARALLRDRRRGRQHPDRRGAHAADHLRRPRTGGRPVREVRALGAADDAGQDARRHGPAHQEAVHGGLRLRGRREAQDRLDHRAGRRQGRALPRHRPSLPRRERPPGQPPDPGAARASRCTSATSTTR